MSYTPLAAILTVLVIGAAVTLTILFRSMRSGQFRNLKAGAYVIFDDDEPVGEPQDQLFREAPGSGPDSDPDGSASSPR